jgi:hypothetical protein
MRLAIVTAESYNEMARWPAAAYNRTRENSMANVISATGRPAWIVGMVVGIVLLVIGLATGPRVWLCAVGGGIFLFGAVMMILSMATKGRTD